jgi:hypothetical protein
MTEHGASGACGKSGPLWKKLRQGRVSVKDGRAGAGDARPVKDRRFRNRSSFAWACAGSEAIATLALSRVRAGRFSRDGSQNRVENQNFSGVVKKNAPDGKVSHPALRAGLSVGRDQDRDLAPPGAIVCRLPRIMSKSKTFSGILMAGCWGLLYRRLVDCRDTDEVAAAIGRGLQLKRWLRQKKIAMAERVNNPEWEKLSVGADRNRDWRREIPPLRSG